MRADCRDNKKMEEKTMQKNIGSVLALYPTPLTVVGAMVDGKPNWTLVGHVGIMSHDRIMVSIAKAHYSNKGIRESKKLSVNVVDESILEKADYIGTVSGEKTDKSAVFPYHIGEAGAPIIGTAQLVMECSVTDVYETGVFENFILAIENTYAEEAISNAEGKIDYGKFKPVLFQMPTYEYLRTGGIIGKCMKIGRE